LKNNKFNIFKIIYLIPIFLITGPFLSDLLVSLTSIFFIFYFLKYEKKYIFNKFSIYFFSFYFFLLVVSFFSVDKYISFKSSVPYFRFFLFSLIVWFCFDKKIIKLKYFYLITFIIICIFFFDSSYQFINGKNFLGQISPLKYRITSFFGDEAIMGSFVLKIYILFAFINLLIKIKHQKKIFITTTIFSIVIIIISGDRTPFFLMLIYFIILSLTSKNNKFYFIGIFLFIIISFGLISKNEILKNRILLMTYSGFFTTLEKFDGSVIDKKIDIDIQNKKKLKHFISDDHHSHFITAKSIFFNNLILGSGPNTFRIECKKKDYFIKQNSCSTHPHNYFLQLSSETGIAGLFILTFIFLYSTLLIVKKILFNKGRYCDVYICVYIFIILFPLSPNGNFFNNWLSILNYLPIGFFLYYYNNRNHLFSKK
jgi:O-antigen ligase